MVNLKPKSKQDEEIHIELDRGFKFKHLLWFILGSAFVHGLLFLFLVRYEAVKPVEDREESKPIEFVVVPPEEKSEEPPPETNNRAAENSVANPNVQPEKTAPNEKIVEEPAETPAPAPAPTPTPEPIVEANPTPAPAPKAEPIPEAVPEAEPEPTAEDLLSGSDAPQTSPQAAAPQETVEEETVATRVPPPTQPVPETSPSDEGSAADLLGGNYKKTLADGGGEAFFSPEALSHKTVLNPGQINALRNVDLSSYVAELKKRVRENWKPSFTQEHKTVFTFDIQKNGQITALKVVQSSGNSEIDRYSLKMFEKISPLPPLPPEFPLEHWSVEYTLEIYLVN